MKFPNTQGGYATASSRCNKPVNVRYEVICKDFDKCLTIPALEKMKVNIQNYFQVTSPKFIALCSKCMCDMNTKVDVTLFGTEGCVYQIWSNKKYHHLIENLSYYKDCVAASKSFDISDGTDANGFEYSFNPENNEDCVSVFLKVGYEDNVVFTTVTILIIVFKIVFDKLSVDHVIIIFDKIPGTIVFPTPEFLDGIVSFDSNNISTSNRCNESDDASHATSLD